MKLKSIFAIAFGMFFHSVYSQVDSTNLTSSLDTLVDNYISSFNKLSDSSSIPSFDKVDTLKNKKFNDLYDLSGEISAGYEYGLLTGYIDT